ncbi:MAG: hypothetical protein MJY67_00775, partial [Bacteroidales bacterium]|nr:hypothetical protein [Bacteroidales bacterium]
AIMLAPQKGFNGYSLRRKASGKYPFIILQHHEGTPRDEITERQYIPKWNELNLFPVPLP